VTNDIRDKGFFREFGLDTGEKKILKTMIYSGNVLFGQI